MNVEVRIPAPFKDIMSRIPGWTPSVIFDVGANVGQSAIAYANSFPAAAVHSFEPVPAAFEKLKQATANLPNVTPHFLALGKSAGSVRMTASGTSTENHIVADGKDASNTVLVEADSGYAVAQRIGVERVSYLKIDTEGHDYNVLLGFSPFLKNVEFIQVEAAMNPYNKTHVPFRLMEDYLRYEGFMLFKFYDQVHEFKKGGRPVLRRSNPVFINSSLFDVTGIS